MLFRMLFDLEFPHMLNDDYDMLCEIFVLNLILIRHITEKDKILGTKFQIKWIQRKYQSFRNEMLLSSNVITTHFNQTT